MKPKMGPRIDLFSECNRTTALIRTTNFFINNDCELPFGDALYHIAGAGNFTDRLVLKRGVQGHTGAGNGAGTAGYNKLAQRIDVRAGQPVART